MTPVFSLPQKSSSVQREISSQLLREGVTPRFFTGDPILEGFAIIHDSTPYVVVNNSLSEEQQRFVAKRELAHLQLRHLQDNQSSLFLSNLHKQEAVAFVKEVIAQ